MRKDDHSGHRHAVAHAIPRPLSLGARVDVDPVQGYGCHMGARMVGVEEELLLIDPDTRRLKAVSEQAVAAHADAVEVGRELFQQQIETSTPPCRTGEELLSRLRAGRRAVGEAAAAAGARAVAVATHPLAEDDELFFTSTDRYRRMGLEYGEIARQ